MFTQDLTKSDGPEVCILMAVHNGAPYLRAQLDSFRAQTGVTWRLIASDDGSDDKSAEILRMFAEAQGPGQVCLLKGPERGIVENFRFLIAQAPTEAFLAFADQDDIWLPDKLQRAVQALNQSPSDRPAMYGSCVLLANASGEALPQRRPKGPRYPLGFRNALVQNVFQGNTVVLNPVAVRLLAQAETLLRAANAAYVLHDWWAYLLMSGAGGTLIHDATPGLLYRQHQGNAIGANSGFAAGVSRIKAMLRGRNRNWMDQHLKALSAIAHLLQPEAREITEAVRHWRAGGPLRRLRGLKSTGLYVQRRRAVPGLWIAALLGKL